MRNQQMAGIRIPAMLTKANRGVNCQSGGLIVAGTVQYLAHRIQQGIY